MEKKKTFASLATIVARIAVFILVIITFNCKKKSTADLIPTTPDVTYFDEKYVLKLSNDTILYYQHFLKSGLDFTVNFYTKDSVIREVKTDSSNKIISVSTYKMGANGYAKAMIDSDFDKNGKLFPVHSYTYYYTNGFLSKTILDTGKQTVSQVMNNNNITEVTFNSMCRNYYTFTSLINKIDLGFNNGLLGKANNNLASGGSYANGCPCGPSSVTASSNFTYELNANNYVTKKVESYTPCHHMGGNVTPTVTTTIYEYK
ncbi:MAG: hypothetical protein NTX03_14465 [Bacteroidetes bacterium]|nr:hypothetical protein [Bacteroidota bacterium]